MPKLSIITINYNNLEGLKRTVESVVNQTWQEFEYIIIDGGSTDGSAHYIESQKENFDYWVSEKDTGIYNAMNKGIKVATGEYLLFLNSGDHLCDNNVLNKISSELTNSDVYYGNMIKLRFDGSSHTDKGPEGNKITISTFIQGTLNHSSSFIKRSLFYKFGFYDENLIIVSDWKFFLISLGMNTAEVKYLNIDISCFDMSGVSNSNIELITKERGIVLLEIVPEPILSDAYKLIKIKRQSNSNRFNMFLELENHIFARKINNLLFKILLKIYKIKKNLF